MTEKKEQKPVAVSEPIRNPAATATGAGAAAVLAWIYNDVLHAKYGLVPMPQGVVVILAVFVVDAVRYWMTRRAVVIEPVVVEDAEKP